MFIPSIKFPYKVPAFFLFLIRTTETVLFKSLIFPSRVQTKVKVSTVSYIYSVEKYSELRPLNCCFILHIYNAKLPTSSHNKYFIIRVIPYQEFRITSWILTKLGTFVVPMGLITHTNF